MRTAKAIAVLGTGSDVGKSVMVAGLCRLLSRSGIRVAPFKAQNMSLNSFATLEGGEMGRAQALQAEACGILPHVDMNPILLKPESDTVSQVIVHGKVFARLEAGAYFRQHHDLFPFVRESYQRLARHYDVVVIEGAGSAAEVNLRDRDLVNWPVVHMADARVVLVADIDRGGVFAQVIGTMDLLQPHERARVIGFVINQFRGDLELFRDGMAFLEQRTGLPVLGVVPFLRGLSLAQEDGLDRPPGRAGPSSEDGITVAVVLLSRLSNCTDFAALQNEQDVTLRYVGLPSELLDADVVIVPGTKNTLEDLQSLKARGFMEALHALVQDGVEVIGICGGYQILGRRIDDPLCVESGGSATGLDLLDVETELQAQKVVSQVQGTSLLSSIDAHARVEGYQIHMGKTLRGRSAPCFTLASSSGGEGERWLDGAADHAGLVWGTYIHGVFDAPSFRREWVNRVRKRKGFPPLPLAASAAVTERLGAELDRWADHVAAHVTLAPIIHAIGR